MCLLLLDFITPKGFNSISVQISSTIIVKTKKIINLIHTKKNIKQKHISWMFACMCIYVCGHACACLFVYLALEFIL